MMTRTVVALSLRKDAYPRFLSAVRRGIASAEERTAAVRMVSLFTEQPSEISGDDDADK